VKLTRAYKLKLLFLLSPTEQLSLVRLLNSYPRISSSHQPLSKTRRVPDLAANQALLEEALAEQRAENRKQLKSWLATEGRFKPTKDAVQLSIARADMEWLLQVLNDIRVGNWLALGQPDESFRELTVETAPQMLAMELAAYFQSHLLDGLRVGTDPGA
jgi:hypothetical protein